MIPEQLAEKEYPKSIDNTVVPMSYDGIIETARKAFVKGYKSRQQEIDGLKAENGRLRKTLDGVCEARDVLKAELDKHQWIPISEKPEKDKWVLLNNGNWTGVGKYTPDENYDPTDEDDFKEPEWSDETGEYIIPEPTRWQPLPSPPKTTVA